VQLSSAGNRKLSLQSIQITGDFVETNNCGRQLKIGQSCTIRVYFQPQMTGVQNGIITIKDNAAIALRFVGLSLQPSAPLRMIIPDEVDGWATVLFRDGSAAICIESWVATIQWRRP
jgi:hypothetical protein